MPMLGIGWSWQLYRQKHQGPVKDTKAKRTHCRKAKALWYHNLRDAKRVFCALGYWIAGYKLIRTPFGHTAFSTRSHWRLLVDSRRQHWLLQQCRDRVWFCTFLWLLSASTLPFAFLRLRSQERMALFKDPWSTFLFIDVLSSTAHSFSTLVAGHDVDLWLGHVTALCTCSKSWSIATTSRFGHIRLFLSWPHLFFPFLLLSPSLFGGCASSTGGGMSYSYSIDPCKQGIRENTTSDTP